MENQKGQRPAQRKRVKENSYKGEEKKSDKKNQRCRDLVEKLVLLLIGSVLTLVVSLLIKICDPTTGDLIVFSNIDSAEVFLNCEYVGKTKPFNTSINPPAYKFEIDSLRPGTFQLQVQKKYYQDKFFTEVKIDPGYHVTKYSELFPVTIPAKDTIVAHIPTEIKKVVKPKGTEIERLINSDSLTNEKEPVIKTLTLVVSEEIDISSVSLTINSKPMGTPSSSQFSINLPEGQYEITLKYFDRFKNSYKYSITKNITENDIILIKKNEFNPI